MLRITPFSRDTGWHLKLEGRLVHPWVELLRQTCQRHQNDQKTSLEIDLASLDFSNRDGLDLLHTLQKQGVCCIGWTPFLKEMSRTFVDSDQAYLRRTSCV